MLKPDDYVLPNPQIIAQTSLQIGGEMALSHVENTCPYPWMVISSETLIPVAVLPDYAQAERAARFAISPDGGYDSVEVSKAHDRKPTYQSFEAWLQGELIIS